MDSLDVVQNQKVKIVMYILYDFNNPLIKKVIKPLELNRQNKHYEILIVKDVDGILRL